MWMDMQGLKSDHCRGMIETLLSYRLPNFGGTLPKREWVLRKWSGLVPTVEKEIVSLQTKKPSRQMAKEGKLIV